MKLSIIIPYYNTKEYTDELLNVLESQLTDDVEVLVVDDGSDKPYSAQNDRIKVLRIKHSGQSKARNTGLNRTSGDYIQFIDSDDIVSDDFIQRILEKIEEDPDIIEFSWRSLNCNGASFNYRVREGERLTNPSACTRTFKRSYIGKVRFTEKKDATEDEDFSRRLGYLYKPVKVSTISDYLYFYRTDAEGSNTKRYKNGLCRTKRIVYYYERVTKDRKDILDAIKKDDEENEVILMTYENEIPALKRWCQILRPCSIWTHYQKGEVFRGCSIIRVPEKYKIVLFINFLNIIGGIESFIYHFGGIFQDVTLLVGKVNERQRKRLEEHVNVVDYDPRATYYCDTLIILRILDSMPTNIFADRTIRTCHGCRTNPAWNIPQDSDFIVNVSEVSKESFGEQAKGGIVIHNPIEKSEKKALILVSATRIPAVDKGKNEVRMRMLAEMLNNADIPFVWFNFSDGVIPNAPEGMVNMGIREDIQPYIKRADYLVQLSDSEAWSYSMLEALINKTPVICCPFGSAEEMGIKDGVNGYVVPFDMGFDVHKLLNVPSVSFDYDHEGIKKAWVKVLTAKKKNKGIKVRIIQTYFDTLLNRKVSAGENLYMTRERANTIIHAGFGEIRK